MNNTQEAPKLTSYQNKLRLNRKYYHQKYNNDPEFKAKEIQRNCERVRKAYHKNPEIKEKMKQRASDRYYRLKAQKEQTSGTSEKNL